MALLKYFRRVNLKEESTFPDPAGPSSKTVPSALIEEANKEVPVALAKRRDKKHLPYLIVSLEQKFGLLNMQLLCIILARFAKPTWEYCEGWKTAYFKEVCNQVKVGIKEVSVGQLPEVLIGQLLLGNQ